jgi:alanine dehydrogenase
MPYVIKLATEGVHHALASDPGFLDGLSVAAGKLTSEPVALDQGRDFVPPAEALGSAPAAA